MIDQWEIKYKPCLDCAQGKEIAANGGEDDDVEELKTKVIGNEQTKYCRYCQQNLPLSNFYQTDGKYLPECKSCASARHKRRAEEKRAAKTIDQIAPNKAKKLSAKAIKAQSIIKNINNINHKDITSPMANNDPNVNIMDDITKDLANDIPAPEEIPPGGKCRAAIIYHEEKPILRFCTRCGFTGPEKMFHMAGNNGYINVCRKCIVKQRKANEQFKKDHTVTLGPQDIVLNFADFPDLLKTLTTEARKNFRTLANEILFRVVNHVN